jgi:hypothetical protein
MDKSSFQFTLVFLFTQISLLAILMGLFVIWPIWPEQAWDAPKVALMRWILVSLFGLVLGTFIGNCCHRAVKCAIVGFVVAALAGGIWVLAIAIGKGTSG